MVIFVAVTMRGSKAKVMIIPRVSAKAIRFYYKLSQRRCYTRRKEGVRQCACL